MQSMDSDDQRLGPADSRGGVWLAGADATPRRAGDQRGPVSLRTLILLRWIAIAGQLMTVSVVHWGFGHVLALGPILAVIGVSVLLNLAAIVQGRLHVRLGDRDAALYLAYDLIQLGALLYLTGGLGNPFAIMLLAPITAAATILRRRHIIALTALGIAVITLLTFFHLPLPEPAIGQDDGIVPESTVSFLYSGSLWIALATTATFIAGYVWRVAAEARRLAEAYQASQAALAREQRLAALGSLAAAAAHELGTPLSTIALVARELQRDIGEDSPLKEDIDLLADQAQRCRDILSDIAAQPDKEGGEPWSRIDLATLVEAAAQPHQQPGIALRIVTDGEPVAVLRTPERLHGLGNLVQNALQFARSRVEVDIATTPDTVTLTIRDDGPGFPPALLARLGEPYVSGRRGDSGHMGLGVFIAVTLLERDGARLAFSNGEEGAAVSVTWPRAAIDLG